MAFIFLAAAFTFNGVANVLLKLGADRGILLDLSLGLPKLLAHNAYVLGGAFLFAVNLLFYIAALRTLPLSVAYPVLVAMSVLLASGLAVAFLHEPLSWQHAVGYILIFAGVALVVGMAR